MNNDEERLGELARLEQQTRLLTMTLTSIRDFAYIFDRDGRFCYANQPLLDLLGITLEEIVGKNFFDLNYPPDLAARLQAQIQQVFETGEIVKDETPFTSPLGVEGFYEYIFTPVLNDDGSVDVVAGSTRDVTERKQIETQLRESEERFRAVADLVPDLLWSNNPRGKTDWHNQRWLEYTGQTLKEAQDDGWLNAAHPDDRETALRSFQAAIVSGNALRYEQRLRRTDGVYRWFLVQARPVRDEAGQIMCWYGAATDINEEQSALAAEHAARAEAEAALQTRDQFLSVASHELRTPLTSLIGYADMLRRALTQGKGDIHKMTEVITRQAQRLNALLEQLLDVTRLQQGQFAIKRQPLDVAAMTAQVVDEFSIALPANTKHPITLSRPDEPVIVVGDVLRLEQVVQNLLNNAVKYSPAGGSVRVRVKCTAGDAIVEVEDQGIGIPGGAQGHLFEPFYRAPNVEAQASGFGLGLHIVGEIVQRHGGRVEVRSTEGVGSTFRVVLPLRDSEDAS